MSVVTQNTETGHELRDQRVGSVWSAHQALRRCHRGNDVLLADAGQCGTLAGSGERFLGLLPLKGERDMLTDIRHTPTATEIVRLSTLLEVRPEQEL